jgi:hypothetical protein
VNGKEGKKFHDSMHLFTFLRVVVVVVVVGMESGLNLNFLWQFGRGGFFIVILFSDKFLFLDELIFFEVKLKLFLIPSHQFISFFHK